MSWKWQKLKKKKSDKKSKSNKYFKKLTRILKNKKDKYSKSEKHQLEPKNRLMGSWLSSIYFLFVIIFHFY